MHRVILFVKVIIEKNGRGSHFREKRLVQAGLFVVGRIRNETSNKKTSDCGSHERWGGQLCCRIFA